MSYFSPTDEHMDRNLILRTLAVFNQIREIATETATGEAFRKYTLRFMEETEAAMRNEAPEHVALWERSL